MPCNPPPVYSLCLVYNVIAGVNHGAVPAPGHKHRDWVDQGPGRGKPTKGWTQQVTEATKLYDTVYPFGKVLSRDFRGECKI